MALAPEDVFIGKEFSMQEDPDKRIFRIVAITVFDYPEVSRSYNGKEVGKGRSDFTSPWYYFVQISP